jgi:hypothetical protein
MDVTHLINAGVKPRRYNCYKEEFPEQILRECLADHDLRVFDFKPVLLDPLLDVYKEEFQVPA